MIPLIELKPGAGGALNASTVATPVFSGLRVLIADSRPGEFKRLKLSLTCMPQVDEIEAVQTVKDFRRAVRQQRPNLVISDVVLEQTSSFDLLAELKAVGLQPEVIFHTATNDQAVRAFEIGAADYVLKPASFERLREAVFKATVRLWTQLASDRFCELQQRIHELELKDEGLTTTYVQSLWFKNGSELAQVAVSDIEWFQAAGDYVIAHTDQRSHMLTESISRLEEKLDPDQVTRVHRSSLINVQRIRSLRKRRPRGIALVLNSGKQVGVGPKYEAKVFGLMNIPRWRQ